MNSKKKKILFIIIVVVLILASTILVLFNKPSVRFMLVMNDTISPPGIIEREVTLRSNGENTPMMVYSRNNAASDRYYFLVHGLTPKSYRHPTIQKIAGAIVWASGCTVFVPYIRGSETDRSIKHVCSDIVRLYTDLRTQYNGSFNAFGACISATILLLALNDVPQELYPKKVFLHGPFLNGEMLADFYNKSGMEIDFIVKMANAIRNKSFSEEEKALLSKAIAATKPGITDREEMKRILGEKLYEKTEKAPVDYSEFKEINELTLFPKNRPLPKCRYYITHSRSDNIIPYSMGMGLHQYLLQRGLPSKFIATGAFQHSDKAGSLLKLAKEATSLMDFFDDLFEE